MADTRSYSIGKNRIRQGLLQGMTVSDPGDGMHEGTESGDVIFESSAGSRNLFLRAIDSGSTGAEWGRLIFKCMTEENTVVIVRAGTSDNNVFYEGDVLRSIDEFLTDPQESTARKKRLFEKMGAVKSVNMRDCLLYSLSGRYLWVYIEVLGEGSGAIGNIRVNVEGDDFMETFPEIYQERNSFFHRYMSVFSSIYNDFQLETEHVFEKIDIDTAPRELLPVFASWLGIDAGNDILTDEQLRTLLKEAYTLCKYKGTRATMERICEIVLGQKVTLIEKNEMEPNIAHEERDTYDRLFGDSRYDLTILINGNENRNRRTQLLFLLNQFKPLRTRINLVFISDRNMLDSYTFLDGNALIKGETDAALDAAQSLDGTEVLK